MGVYEAILRPLLFLLPPERAQAVAETLLKRHGPWHLLSRYLDYRDPRLCVNAVGLKFPSPVGLAAGFDKNCEMLGSLLDLGFGYVVGGTVLPQPRVGNPRPRLTRVVSQQSLINSLGFPSQGMMVVGGNLERLRRGLPHPDKPIMVSVSGLTVEEFLACHAALEPLADAVELNISSPNTQGIRAFQEPATFGELLDRINGQRRRPIFAKIPPYNDDSGREKVLGLVHIARQMGIDGITAANTRPVEAPQLAMGRGGLSGRSLAEDMRRIVSEVRAEVGPSMAINACGGVFTAEDALRALQSGANTVQLLTALVYRGPSVVRSINRGLVRLMEEHGCASLAELAGGMVS